MNWSRREFSKLAALHVGTSAQAETGIESPYSPSEGKWRIGFPGRVLQHDVSTCPARGSYPRSGGECRLAHPWEHESGGIVCLDLTPRSGPVDANADRAGAEVVLKWSCGVPRS
ncbi:MAG: hypothetical protein ACKV22_31020 [Bryobacteraceae bacterium]